MTKPESNRQASFGDEPTLGWESGGAARPNDPDSPSGRAGLLDGRYELQALLGRGGMGEVWKGWDRQLNRAVAIKRIRAEIADRQDLLARFFNEARCVAGVVHPNLVTIHDLHSDPQSPYLVMELVNGESLASRLQQTGRMTLADAVRIVEPVCRALSAVHEKGVVHRDIKPSNVLVSAGGTPKLTDFGLARIESADHGQTQSGMVLGTLDFMAPEQAADPRQAGARSDLWSLAATLYQMLTGSSPRVIDLSQAPAIVRPVLAKALAQNPRDRYATVEEFRLALVAAVQQSDTWASLANASTATAERIVATPPSQTGANNGTWLLVGLGAILLLIVIGYTANRPASGPGPSLPSHPPRPQSPSVAPGPAPSTLPPGPTVSKSSANSAIQVQDEPMPSTSTRPIRVEQSDAAPSGKRSKPIFQQE